MNRCQENKDRYRTKGQGVGRWKMGMRGGGGPKMDRRMEGQRMEGQSDKGCWLWNEEHCHSSLSP